VVGGGGGGGCFWGFSGFGGGGGGLLKPKTNQNTFVVFFCFFFGCFLGVLFFFFFPTPQNPTPPPPHTKTPPPSRRCGNGFPAIHNFWRLPSRAIHVNGCCPRTLSQAARSPLLNFSLRRHSFLCPEPGLEFPFQVRPLVAIIEESPPLPLIPSPHFARLHRVSPRSRFLFTTSILASF